MPQQFDFAIVSGVSETEIQQIKKKYITDRIRESVDIFGSQPERLGSIIMTAVTALALLISKLLDKASELSAKFFENEVVQTVAEPSGERTTQIISQTISFFPLVGFENAQKREESVYSRLQNYQRESTNRQTKQSSKNMGRGER